ncbi:MAG: hypothetical protein NTZ33_06595 [Bacteroidetes bacterium]|nr:hypothetical protein [Bacteroidota bacterium]
MRNYSIVSFITFLFFIACSKDESDNKIPPILHLKIGNSYIANDTAIAEGSQITIGISALANGGENLCNLVIKSNNSLSLLDFGFNAASIDKDFVIHKNTDSIQKISIIIYNKTGLCDSIVLKLYKNGSAYKAVIYYPSITLGGQNNTSIGSFSSFSNGLVYNLNDASTNQALIDLLYYYSVTNQEYNCIASPGANITGIFSGANAPEFWSVKNTTYFSRTVINIPLSSFDNALNDSIIIANIFSNGGRKAKALTANQIWGFQTQTGKFGLMKIINVNGLESGTVQIAVKLQQ